MSFKIVFAFTLLMNIFFPSSLADSRKCRALVLQGGGDKGSYQVGALSEMVRLIPEEIHYDVVSGVSAGALNAGGFSQFLPGQEAEAVDFLMDLWKNINSSDVYQEWAGGLIDGIFYEPSLFDSNPLYNLLEEKLSKPVVRKLSLGSVDADRGQFVRFNESLNRKDLLLAAMASAALPALFPYISLNNTNYVDGGVLLGVDVDGAVQRCREIVSNDSDIIVDVLMCSGDSLPKVKQDGDKTLQMLGRFLQIHFYSSALDHLLHAFEDNPDIFFRYVIMPTKSLASEPLPLQFNQEEIQEMINQGIQDANQKITNKIYGLDDIEERWGRVFNKVRKSKIQTHEH